MKIILLKKIRQVLYRQIKKYSPKEIKGALFAEKVNDDIYKIEEVYIEKQIGSVAYVKLYNNERYKAFQKEYHLKHREDYLNHNYIGDWHSHPSFDCIPSVFDVSEVILDMENSNADFLIQIILKVSKNKLIGNAYLYNNEVVAKQIELVIL